jgi:hypothetical protein
MSKGHSPTSFLPTLPLPTSADSLLKSQPRLIVMLGLVPTVLAFVYWKVAASSAGFVVAGLILAGALVFLTVQAGLKKMTPVAWAMVAGVGFVAVLINAGNPGVSSVILSFGSLLFVVVLAWRLPAKQRLVAGAIAFFAWLGTAGAPGMASTHDTAQAGIVEASVVAWDWLRVWLAGVIG